MSSTSGEEFMLDYLSSRPPAGAKKRALAATGLIATTAAGGLGLAAVTAAEAQAASGVVHACYSKSTHALNYAKKAKCPKGSKLVTWNKRGPHGARGLQGPQGTQGPQGATGTAATGWANERYSQGFVISASGSAVVASVTPGSGGYFAVNGFAEVHPNHSGSYGFHCWDQGGQGTPTLGDTTNRTPSASGSGGGILDRFPIPTGGIIAAGPTAPIYEVCSIHGFSGRALQAEVTAVHLGTAHAVTSGGPPARKQATHSFSRQHGAGRANKR